MIYVILILYDYNLNKIIYCKNINNIKYIVWMIY